MITIVDYNAGNITSVKRALTYLGIDCHVSGNPDEVRSAEKIIFPGVGHALSAMNYLKESGLGEAITEAAAKGTPILGICVGTQILLTRSEEGDAECLNMINGNVRRFISEDTSFKIPHMGWNSLIMKQKHPIFEHLQSHDEFYFVHSYYVSPDDQKVVVAACDYITEFPAIIADKNIAAVQFHPEKSGKAGLSILSRFADWKGEWVC